MRNPFCRAWSPWSSRCHQLCLSGSPAACPVYPVLGLTEEGGEGIPQVGLGTQSLGVGTRGTEG